MATELRNMGVTQNIGFFLHIPFPSLDLFLKIPQRFSILESLLSFNLIGFQTMRDKRNFIESLRLLMPNAIIRGKKNLQTVSIDGRGVFVGAFPISIDYKNFARRASLPQVIEKSSQIRHDLPDRELILGIDRLDYSKGLLYRLKAFAYALEKYPDLLGKTTFIQVVVPSREDIPGYHRLKEQIERLVGEINGRFTMSGWVPVHYIYRSLGQVELVAYYRACRVGFVTPLKDGMNLVAKEFCACSIDKDCALVLSEFAGAAGELQNGAFLINPYDIEGTADALHSALTMDSAERKKRMQKLRNKIRDHTIYDWIDHYLGALASKTLNDFPIVDDYLPTSDNVSEYIQDDENI
jgi:trehalose 6-phosphate synthase